MVIGNEINNITLDGVVATDIQFAESQQFADILNFGPVNSVAEQGAELTTQQKVLARYGTIMDQTARAQGDMARTLNDPSNAMRALKSNVEQLGIEFGQTLIPTLQTFIKTGKSIVDWYNSLDAGNKAVANSMAKTTIEVGAAATGLMALRMIGIPINPWVALATAVALATKGIADHLIKRKELKEFEASKNLGSDPSTLNAKLRLNADTGEIEKEVARTITILGYKVPRLPIWVKLEGVEKAEAELQAARAKWAIEKGDNPAPDLNKLRAEMESNRQLRISPSGIRPLSSTYTPPIILIKVWRSSGVFSQLPGFLNDLAAPILITTFITCQCIYKRGFNSIRYLMLKLESTVAKSELLTANNSLRMVNKSLKTYESEVKAETRKLKFERDFGYLVAVVMLLKNKKYAV